MCWYSAIIAAYEKMEKAAVSNRQEVQEKMNHKILIESEAGALKEVQAHLRRCIRAALEAEGVQAAVRSTSSSPMMRASGRSTGTSGALMRTDVLSFPMFDLVPGALPENLEEEARPGYRSGAAG